MEEVPMICQGEMFHEDLREALRHVVNGLGGPKRVGSDLRPAMAVDQARAWLNNCLSDNRPEKLDLEDVVYILRAGRMAGIHSAMAWMARECGYADPHPIEPGDEQAELERAFIQSVEAQKQILQRMERLQAGIAGLKAVRHG